jgi:carbon starvation protein
MCATIPFLAGAETVIYAMLILAVSVFCLTSLDTATRLARYMFQEFWLEPGQTWHEAKGWRKTLTNPLVATVITVIAGIAMGMTGYAKIWPLFGAANQLLAALGLLTVATWLGKMGKNNKMFLFPMAFMLVVTLTSLVLTLKGKIAELSVVASGWGIALTVLAVLLIILAVVLAVTGIRTLIAQHGEKQKEEQTA